MAGDLNVSVMQQKVAVASHMQTQINSIVVHVSINYCKEKWIKNARTLEKNIVLLMIVS